MRASCQHAPQHPFRTVDELDRTTKEEGGIYEETKKEKEAKRKDDKKMQKLQEKLHTDDERMWGRKT